MTLFVAWTPYQVLNILNFVLNNVEDTKNQSDIYIYHGFRKSKEISNKLKESNIFNNVYDIYPLSVKRKPVSFLYSFLRLLFPKQAIKKYIKPPIKENQHYDKMVLSGALTFAVILYERFRPDSIIFIEDGVGSYYGDIRIEGLSNVYKLFNKVFRIGPYSYNVDKIYLYRPELCDCTITDKYCQLPQMTHSYNKLEIIKKIFSYKENNIYQGNRLIYLTQPIDNVGQYEEAEKKILESLPTDDLIVRVHPRQQSENYDKYLVDNVDNLWEIECLEQISSSHILISWFSSAAFSPKLVSNKEPYLIFTYYLFGKNEQSISNIEVNRFINSIKKMYTDPSKIYLPNSIEEIQEILREIN